MSAVEGSVMPDARIRPSKWRREPAPDVCSGNNARSSIPTRGATSWSTPTGSAVAHPAGAMGRAVWVALSAAADWCWLRDREDGPWYPTMRLFRQTTWRA